MSHHKIPLAAKVAGAAFLAVLVPVYLHTYGPANFLWFCDAALILTVAGMWWESSRLISTCSVGILLPQCLWLADFGSNLLGISPHPPGLAQNLRRATASGRPETPHSISLIIPACPPGLDL